jgi:hypothetical protein
LAAGLRHPSQPIAATQALNVYAGVSALLFPTYHPNSGFSMKRWHPVVWYFLEKRAASWGAEF